MDLSHIRFSGHAPANHRVPPPRPEARVWTRATASPSPEPAGPLADAVLRTAGLDPATYRSAPLARRVPACLRALRAGDEDTACRTLATTPALVQPVLSTLLIGVSAFFRDEAVFDLLRSAVIPGLPANRTVRVLSVGCSNGAELYCVAMLLADAGRLDGAQVVGVDCRAEALAEAREGVFAADALAPVDEATRRRHFVPVSGGYRVADRLRQRVTWELVNATGFVPAGPWDLVLCRNLAIYLVPAASDVLFTRLTSALVPGGHLVVGKAERPPAALPLTALGRCVHVRRAD